MSDLISRSELTAAIKRQYCTGCDNYNGSRCRACHADDMLSLVDDAVDAQRWISVEERLPEGEVLAGCFDPGAYCYGECIIGYVSSYSELEGDGYRAENSFELLDAVTHWMPLPEPPEKEATP